MANPIDTANHILVIQPLVGIGDMIWHKPWIDRLAAKTKITLAAKPTAQPAILFPANHHPALTHLPIQRSMRGKQGRHDGISGLFRLASDFRNTGADMAIILHHSPRYVLACMLAGIKFRLGYGHKFYNLGLNTGLPLDRAMQKSSHAIDRISHFSAQNGFGIDAPEWILTPSEQAIDWATMWLSEQHLIAQNGRPVPFMLFGIGAMDERRCWPAEHFAKLAGLIAKSPLAMPILIIAAPNEEQFLQKILAEAPKPSDLIPAITSLKEAVALMSLATGFVGNDSGLLNLMACLNIPALGLFSHSKPLTYSPYIYKLELFDDHDYGSEGIINRITPEAVCARMMEIWPARTG